jgi:hypothetical protein
MSLEWISWSSQSSISVSISKLVSDDCQRLGACGDVILVGSAKSIIECLTDSRTHTESGYSLSVISKHPMSVVWEIGKIQGCLPIVAGV